MISVWCGLVVRNHRKCVEGVLRKEAERRTMEGSAIPVKHTHTHTHRLFHCSFTIVTNLYSAIKQL